MFKYLFYIFRSFYYIRINSFIPIICIICKKKIINLNSLKYTKKIKKIFVFFSYITKFLLLIESTKLLKNAIYLIANNNYNYIKSFFYYYIEKNNKNNYNYYVS